MNNIRVFIVCSSAILMGWLSLSYSIKLEHKGQRNGANVPQTALNTPAETGDSAPGITAPAPGEDELPGTAALADLK